MVGNAKPDQITQQLASTSDADGSALLNWVQYCSQRDVMLHRTTSCALAGWLLVFSVAILSTLMTWHFQNSTIEVVEVLNNPIRWHSLTGNRSPTPDTLSDTPSYLTWTLISTCVLCGLLPFAWRKNLVPVFRRLRNDIDWTTTGQAMGQLIPLGIPYPTAFRFTANSLRCGSQRKWLEQAAQSVEAGQPTIPNEHSNRPDTAVLYTVMSHTDSMAQHDWEAVAQHYDSCARRTLSLLLAAMPVASTLAAGLILWLAITSSFGDFYQTLASSIRQFGF
jgi:hypothetical protein